MQLNIFKNTLRFCGKLMDRPLVIKYFVFKVLRSKQTDDSINIMFGAKIIV